MHPPRGSFPLSILEKAGNRYSSEAEAEVLEGQEAQEKQASVAPDTRDKGPPVAGQDAEVAEDGLNEIHYVAEGGELAEAEAEDDDSEYVIGGEGDTDEPSQWKSHILCVGSFCQSKGQGFMNSLRRDGGALCR